MKALGYDHNDGGINNQKLAILGLFLSAYEEKSRIFIPNIWSKDQHNMSSSYHPFDEVFWMEPVQAFAKRWGIEFVERPTEFVGEREIRNGWNFFNKGAGYVDHTVTHYRSEIGVDIVADLVRSMVPRINHSKIFQQICHEIFFKRGLNTVIQMRIEEDWKLHAQHHLNPTIGQPEDYFISPEKIIAKFKNTKVISNFPDHLDTVFVTCDERYMDRPKELIRQSVKSETGIDITFKSDIISEEFYQELRPVDASLIDFEIAKLAKNFVGLSRSTFANLVCFERHIQSYRNQTSDYIYNSPGPLLRLRKDMGSRPDPQNAAPE